MIVRLLESPDVSVCKVFESKHQHRLAELGVVGTQEPDKI